MLNPVVRNHQGVVVVVAAVSGCDGVASNVDAGVDVVEFGADPFVVVDSDAGAFHVELRSSPQPPTVGIVPFDLRVTDDDGPVAGLRFSVRPWMPVHNHGPTVQPIVTDDGDGRYLLTEVNLFMAGDWALECSFDDDGVHGADFAAPRFTVR